MEHLQEFWLPYTISNSTALLTVFLAWKKPIVARNIFCVIFLAASIVNAYVALTNPQDYLNYAEFAVLEIYRQFILGWFAEHTQLPVLSIAVGQCLISIGMFLNGRLLRPAIVGVIVFGLAIAPLGIGSAFPCSAILAFAAALLWKSKVEA